MRKCLLILDALPQYQINLYVFTPLPSTSAPMLDLLKWNRKWYCTSIKFFIFSSPHYRISTLSIRE
ncbi:hypothetical protein CAAN1_10S03004 [[Candida] anglica]|uniref:Uncharacterized protein n=1 Tax=[Candida] anglica TaxID=148631 RepID=A0ABP0EFT0_9ASCO